MQQIYPTGPGIVLNCTSSSGATRVPLPKGGDSPVVTNIGYFDAFMEIGDATVTALAPGATSSYPIFARTKEDGIVIDPSAPYAAAPYAAGVCRNGETTTLIIHMVKR